MCQLRPGRTSVHGSVFVLLHTVFTAFNPIFHNDPEIRQPWNCLILACFWSYFFFLIFCGPNFHNLTLYEYVRAFSLIDRCESGFYFIFLALTLHPFRGITVLNWIFLCLTLFVHDSSWPYLLGSVFLLLFTALLFTEILKSDNSLFSLFFRS